MAIGISGMGVICSIGRSVKEVEANLYCDIRNCVTATKIHPEALDLPFFAVGLESRAHSARDTLDLARIAAREALFMAGWNDLKECAIIVGTTSGTALHFLESYRKRKPGNDSSDYVHSNPALTLAKEFGATGPALTISNACTSGADAIGLGMDLIKSGQAARALCGGADAFSLVAHTGFSRLMLYDKKPCRPFDAFRKGMNMGEGAAFLCLESDGRIGRVMGFGSHCDAWHLTAPHPQGLALRLAIREALEQSGIGCEDIGFINAHATATRENDKVEGKTLGELFPKTPVWASKGLTGHTLGAAGAMEAIFSLIALRNGMVPASAGFNEPDMEIGIVPTREDTKVNARFALSTSLGFGGGNSVIVMGTR